MLETISNKLFALLFFVGGIVSLIYYLIERKKQTNNTIKETGVFTEGIISNLEKSPSSNNSFENNNLEVMDKVTINFKTKKNESITTELKQNLAIFYTGQYKIGEKIELYYNPTNPKQIYVETKQSESNSSLLIIAVSFVLILIGLFLLIQ